MPMPRKRIIWLFAFGFLIFYTPYAALSKAVTAGLLPGLPKGLPGLEILPAAILGTVLMVPLIITSLRWWKYASWRRIAGIPFPVTTREIAISGLGLALIIGSTTVAFTFHGISIVLALILMRGGLLIMAPLIDAAFRRRVRWFSWAALAISLTALGVSLAAANNYSLPLLALLNLAVYLTGYALRTPLMTKLAKVDDRGVTRRYFVQEVLVTIMLLPAIPALIAFLGSSPPALALRRGFTTFWSMDPLAIVPIVLIGVFYASHNIFGTLIYLDFRENTFCVPLFCGASFLAGFLAVMSLSLLTGFSRPPASQFVSASMVLFALLFLSPFHHRIEDAWAFVRDGGARLRGAALLDHRSPEPSPRLLLFVCSGNTCRSPMAAAIANAELALRSGRFRAESAGLNPVPGSPMTDASMSALEEIGVAVSQRHEARRLTAEQVAAADAIYCMTVSLRMALIRDYPDAASKTHSLDPDGDIPDPIGKAAEIYSETARRIQALVRVRFDAMGVTG
jgi:protein-tyrosine-phosphatase